MASGRAGMIADAVVHGTERGFSLELMTPAAVKHLLRTTPTIAPVAHRSLIYVHGSQATEFLNGLLASPVPNPPRGPFYSAFLHAQVCTLVTFCFHTECTYYREK